MYDLIIIGAGPAGLTAGIYAKRANLKTLILEKESIGGQIASSPLVENYPGLSSVSGAELANNFFEQAMNLGVDFEIEEVLKIEDGDIKKVITDQNTYEAKAIIVATGAKYKRLGLDNEEDLIGNGVHFCASCDGAFYKDKVVAIIGGANSAIQNAIFLSSICKKIHLVFIKEDLDCENALKDILNTKKNIKKYPKSTVTKLIGDPLCKIEINNKEEIDVDGVFVSIGMDANTSLVKDLLDLNSYNYVVSDDCLTNKKGIFVAGDCRSKNIRQVTTATGDGTIAAIQAIKYLEK